MNQENSQVMIIRSSDPFATARGFTQKSSISDANSPCQGLSMVTGTLPLGVKVVPHFHPYEEIVYLVKGIARMFYGDNLEHAIDISAGDFLYVPANVIHYPMAIGDVACEHVIARAAAHEIICPPEDKARKG